MTDASSRTPNPARTGPSNDNLTIPEDPFEGREFGGYVFRDRHDRNFFIGRMTPRERENWRRDNPDSWQTREEFLRDRQARAGSGLHAKSAEPTSTISATEVPASAGSDSQSPLPIEHNRQPDKAARDTAPQPIANPEVTDPPTAAAGDEIVIDDQQLLGERLVAEMLGVSLRTLERWRKQGKGPPCTKIGRKVYYEINDLRQWIDRGKIR